MALSAALAGILAGIRLVRGPSLADRVISLDAALVALMGAIGTRVAEIDNVAPTATFNYPAGDINEGSTFELSVTAPYDPSTADTEAEADIL